MPGQVAALAVYTQFQHPPSQVVFASLKTEVGSIMSPLGLDIDWRMIETVRGTEVSEELAVVTFKGACETGGLPPAPFSSGALGWTHIADGVVIPFMEVECDRIRGFVRARFNGVDPADRERVLGRAIGRVVAHELYHILGRSTHHGSGRVRRPVYTVQELLSDRFLLEETECRVLHATDSTAPPAHHFAFDEVIGSARKGLATFVEKRCSLCHGSRGEGTRRAPALRAPGRMISSVVLAAQLGIDSGAMCHRADQLKIVPPSLALEDLADLLSFLNNPPY